MGGSSSSSCNSGPPLCDPVGSSGYDYYLDASMISRVQCTVFYDDDNFKELDNISGEEFWDSFSRKLTGSSIDDPTDDSVDYNVAIDNIKSKGTILSFINGININVNVICAILLVLLLLSICYIIKLKLSLNLVKKSKNNKLKSLVLNRHRARVSLSGDSQESQPLKSCNDSYQSIDIETTT